jgi:hypothetical protein
MSWGLCLEEPRIVSEGDRPYGGFGHSAFQSSSLAPIIG